MKKDQLSVIVSESGLEKTKAQVLLDNFSSYFEIVGEWEKKAKAIIVTDASQTAEMQMARAGRLFLLKKRTAIEHTRKKLKEQSLREGKAIDGISNVLKALIIPIEEYLEKQERFIAIKAAEEAERKRIEEEKKAEEEQRAKEKAEDEERERIRKENIRLKKEAEERERKMEEERDKAERAKEAQENKLRKQREASELAKEEERKKHEIALEVQREIAEKERIEADRKKRIYEEKLRKEKEAKEEAERKTKLAQERFRELQLEREKAEAAAYALKNASFKEANVIECPFCHKSFKLE